MIRASIQVRAKSSDFSITVCAENLQRAVEFAARRYPGLTVGLRFPLDPEAFFVEESCLGTGTSGLITDEASGQAVSERGAVKLEAGYDGSGQGETAPAADPRDAPTDLPGRVITAERRSPG